MADPLAKLKTTVAKLSAVETRRASLIEERDRQIVDALAQGSTWVELQRITELSPRGLKLAIDRHRRSGAPGDGK